MSNHMKYFHCLLLTIISGFATGGFMIGFGGTGNYIFIPIALFFMVLTIWGMDRTPKYYGKMLDDEDNKKD